MKNIINKILHTKFHIAWPFTIFGILVVLLISLLSTEIRSEWKDWSIEDQNLFKLLVVGSTLDYVQTKNALDNGYTEGNPIYGDNPSSERLLITKGLSLGVTYWAFDTIEYTPYRRKGLLILNGLQWGIVIRNEHIGATFRYNW
mgnify:CR=1 FL=1